MILAVTPTNQASTGDSIIYNYLFALIEILRIIAYSSKIRCLIFEYLVYNQNWAKKSVQTY